MEHGSTSLSANSGVTADDYWQSRGSFWTTYYTPERFPMMTRIWETGAFDQPFADEDGVELLVARSTQP